MFFTAIATGLLPAGVPVPPIQGELWVNAPTLLGIGIVDAAARGDQSLIIPANPVLVGTHLYYQAATAGGATTLTNVVDAIVTS